MEHVEAAAGEHVIPRGNSAVDFQVTNRALDPVSHAIRAPVPADSALAIGFGLNAGTDADLIQAGMDDRWLVPSQDRKQPNEVQTI